MYEMNVRYMPWACLAFLMNGLHSSYLKPLFVTMSSSSSAEFSASDTGSESEDGLQPANASAAGPKIASKGRQRGRPLQRLTDPVRSRNSDSSELQNRLRAIQQYLPRTSEYSTAFNSADTQYSRTSSMAVSVLSRSTITISLPSSTRSSYTAPSLSTSVSTLRSGPSVRTARTSSVTSQRYGIEEDEQGVPTLPEEENDVRLECCFGFLRCQHIFNDLEQWDCHCRAHYRGHLPRVAQCPFPGCGWEQQTQQGKDVWQDRLDHMEEEHDEEDYTWTQQRPTVSMLQSMFQARMIDGLQYQELRRDGQLSDQPALNTTSPREDRRRRR